MDRYTRDVDIVLLRKRKKRRRQLIKFTAFMFIVGTAVMLYSKRDVWFPKLEGIGSRFQRETSLLVFPEALIIRPET